MAKITVTLSDIRNLTHAALLRGGAADWIATEVTNAVVAAEARGNVICGLYYLESYCLQLASGRVDGQVEPEVSTPRPGSVRVDAKFGFAQPAFARALPAALDAVATNGTASLAVCHAHTCTSLGYFTEQIARAGYIGIGFTNATPIVAPPGGKTRIIGTNPIAFSVPNGLGGFAMQFDQSTSAVALGKITMAKAAGEKIPLGWAVDKDGQPTTDPDAALQGALVSSGGYKGWGFGLMAEILAAGMSGGLLSQDVKPLKAPSGAPHDLGQFYLIIDPGTSEAFPARLAQLAKSISAEEGARMPGQGKVLKDVVEVDEALWTMLSNIGA